uniref:Uncharacterized protein n=1 Tax=viral metagenome TaxID=1070528 RepID=A0A6C0BNA2_9ZZZZ
MSLSNLCLNLSGTDHSRICGLIVIVENISDSQCIVDNNWAYVE